MKRRLFRSVLWAACIGGSASAVQAETFAWVQYTAGGLEARSVTDAPACPRATIDGADVAMAVRAAPGGDYPVTTCTVTLPKSAKSVTVDGVPVALPVADPKRIAVVGDTGCRLKGIYTQGCNDPAQWPFARIAAQIEREKPDLIIHVGDYHYRETPCPVADSVCSGSPFGDTWAAWRADFFTPAASLLRSVPWVVVRGNHEDCERAGKGWSRTLEPMAFDAKSGCNGQTPPYFVRLPKTTLAIVDVVLAPEEKVDSVQAEIFRTQYLGLEAAPPGPIWLLQHRPIWGAGGMVAGFPFGDNKTLAAAARTTLPKRVQMMLTGHHHVFQALAYVDDLPPQVTVGHGGDYLNSGRTSDPAGIVINGVTVRAGVNEMGQFGYAMIEPQNDGWVITNFDVEGRPRHRCGLKNRQVACIKG
jgi:Calcineurin-like phosphoesterase